METDGLILAAAIAALLGAFATAVVLWLIDHSSWEKDTDRRVLLNDPRLEAKVRGKGPSLARKIMRIFFGIPKEATAWLEKGPFRPRNANFADFLVSKLFNRRTPWFKLPSKTGGEK